MPVGTLYKKHRQLFIVLLFISTCVIGAITIYHHEMWRDESQAFLLVRDSKNLGELWQNVRYEGHPILWHLILFVAYHIFPSIYTIQVVHLLIGLSVVALIVFYSPFSFVEKFLLCFSYFFSFEYLIISRNYSIGVFLLFLSICLYLRKKSKRTMINIAVVLGLAANTNIYSFIISCCLFTCFLCNLFPLNKLSFYKSKLFYATVLVFLVFLTTAMLQLVAPPDRTPKLKIAATLNYKRMAKISKEISNVLFYLPAPLEEGRYWGTSLFERNHLKSNFVKNGVFLLPQLLALTMIILAIGAWRRSLLISMFFAASFTGFLLFMSFIFDRGQLRHTGAFFVLLIACTWLYRSSSTPTNKWTLYFNYFFTTMLLTQLAASVFVHVYEIKYPFSGAKDAATFLTNSGRNNDKILLHPDFEAMALLHYGSINQVYYPTIDARGSFIKFNDKRKPRSYKDILKIGPRDDIETMVFNGRRNDSAINAIGYELLYYPKIHSTVPDEDFWIYGKKHK